MSEPRPVHNAQDLPRQAQAVESVQDADHSSQSRDLLRVLVVIAALAIATLGLLGGSIGLLLSFFGSDTDSLSLATLSLSILVLTVGLGLLLAWHSGSAIRGRPSAVFHPRKIGFLVLLFVLSLIFGQIILSQNLLPLVSFPPFHIMATVLPALVILALVGRGLGQITSRRDIVFQLAGGAFLGAPLAFALEALALLSLLGITLVGLAARPGGQDLLQFWSTYLQDPTHLQDPSLFAPFIASPGLVAVVILFVAGIVPLIEEAVKTVGVGLMGYRKLTVSQALLWGVAGGAGFAIVEGLLNTTGGFAAWAPLVVVRVGATLLHCTTGALMGIAWYHALARRRWARAASLYAACIAIHGLWNALSGGMALLSLEQSGTDLAAGNQAMTGLGIVIMLLLLGILTMTMIFSLLGLTLYVRKQNPPPQIPDNRQSPPAPATIIAQELAGTDYAEE